MMAPIERDKVFQLRLSGGEIDALRKLADAAGVSASDWIRLHIRSQVQIPQQGVAERLLKESQRLADPGTAVRQLKRIKDSAALKGAPRKKKK